jgi:hypothetical protein
MSGEGYLERNTMKYAIHAVRYDGIGVELCERDDEVKALWDAESLSSLCPLAVIHLYLREPFELPSGKPIEGQYRLSLVAKFKDGEEVK